MPTYEYRCSDCDTDFELEATVAEYEEGIDETCPECDSQQTTRRLGSVMISMGDASPDGPQGGGCTPGGGCC
ncbi:FmdB family zinc ribbon protein [Salinibacter altiplanensis]|uniref:FmdB family zinc ribbon protein n=1 Tax=Salinibacter altiplanensis TaxID=1803181 RepID=UPI000C9FA45D|nr:zinc ribbon domain-containing protein [Salinibacter altiplanensis]